MMSTRYDIEILLQPFIKSKTIRKKKKVFTQLFFYITLNAFSVMKSREQRDGLNCKAHHIFDISSDSDCIIVNVIRICDVFPTWFITHDVVVV